MAKSGRGTLARTLREARLAIGTGRTASLLRTIEVEAAPFFTLLICSAFQPRAIADALEVSFAIAGLRVHVRALDGFAALNEALAGPDEAVFAEVELAVFALLARGEGGGAAVADLAGGLVRRCKAPVLAVSIGEAAEKPRSGGIEHIVLSVPGAAIDNRFGATFGAIPTEAAADRLADRIAARAARLRGLAPKLLVTDLDGTLWSGTLGEGDVGDLHAAYAGALRSLSGQGVVLALASRNDPGDVDAVFAAHPEWPVGRDGFAAAAIGWEAKDELVGRVLATLSLSPEHMIFVDDDAANCARVAARFADADVRYFDGGDEAFAATLLGDPLLVEAGGGEAGDRRELYRRREAVERLRADAPDLGAFLRRLDTQITMVPLSAALAPRAAELALRVNQFALNDDRPTVAVLSERASPLDFMLRLDDAFGAHGLVGLVLAYGEADAVIVESLFLSCRALGRGIEEALLAALGDLARRNGYARVEGRIEVLPRNEPARRCFSAHVGNDGASWAIRPGDGRSRKPEGVTLRWETTTN